jgi:hypothetical protein
VAASRESAADISLRVGTFRPRLRVTFPVCFPFFRRQYSGNQPLTEREASRQRLGVRCGASPEGLPPLFGTSQSIQSATSWRTPEPDGTSWVFFAKRHKAAQSGTPRPGARSIAPRGPSAHHNPWCTRKPQPLACRAEAFGEGGRTNFLVCLGLFRSVWVCLGLFRSD